MGEKLHYYCSSSEDEGDGGDEGAHDGGKGDDSRKSTAGASAPPPKFVPESELKNGHNTGPKGVLEDWRRFKQLERENRADAAEEKAALTKKLALTCRTDKQDERAKLEEEKLDEDLENLLDDDYLKEFMERRMREMMVAKQPTKRFGFLIDLSGGEAFLDAIDKEDKAVTVVVFIYEDGTAGCEPMHKALQTVVKDYPGTKFCRVRASHLPKLSRDFKVSGVPALLVYRGGEMVTNFVAVNETLGGDDFYASDVESFLVEHGVIMDKELVPSIVRGPAKEHEASDSD